MTRITDSRILAALALLACAPAGYAATFCVDTAAELRTAMTTASTNGADDVIRIKTGAYSGAHPINATTAFLLGVQENFGLTLQGGWVPLVAVDCGRRITDPALTVLSGSNLRKVLLVIGNAGTSGALAVENLTLRDGNATDRGAGLHLFGNYTGNVRIEYVNFFSNDAGSFAGGASISTGGIIEVRNNLFRFNSCPNRFCAGEIFGQTASPSVIRTFFGNNTVVNNRCSPGAPSCTGAGVGVYGPSRGVIFNNAFAFNDGFDVDVSPTGANVDLLFNNINESSGTPANSIGNINVADPLFENPLAPDYRLRFSSPLRDAGTSNLVLGEVDFNGLPRINNGLVDIGAFENDDAVFRNSFENPQ